MTSDSAFDLNKGKVLSEIELYTPKTKTMFLLFLLFVSAYLFIDFISYKAGYAGGIINALILLVIFVISLCNLKKAFVLLLPFIILSDDLSKNIYSGEKDFFSILNYSFGSLPVFHFFTYFLLLLLASVFIYRFIFNKNTSFRIPKFIGRSVFYLILLYLTAALIGLPNIFSFSRAYISDLSPLLYLGTFFGLTALIIKDKKDLNLFVWLILLAIGAKSFVWFTQYVIGTGYHWGTALRVTFESGKVLQILLIFTFSALLIASKKRKITARNLFYFFMAFIGFFNLFVFAGRMAWMATFVGFLMFLTFLSTKTRIKALISGIIIVAVTAGSAYLIRPEAFKVFELMARTIPETFSGKISEENHSSSVRFLEAVNIWGKLTDNNNLLWGDGLGGSFDFKYLTPPFAFEKGDYSDEEISSGRFFKPHNTFLNVFLKMGLIGLIFFLFIFGMFVVQTYKNAKFQIGKSQWKCFSIGFACSMPLILLNNWTSKMNLLIGVLLALVLRIYTLSKAKIKNY
jgi:hypothetical protein